MQVNTSDKNSDGSISTAFFNELHEIDGFTVIKKLNGAIIIPPKTKYYYMPRIIVKDLERLEMSLRRYIATVKEVSIKSTVMDDKHDEKYFLFWLIKNLTNYDCNNIEEFIDVHTAFISDNTFSDCNTTTEIGNLDEDNILFVKKSEEYYGSETPYIMKFFIKNKHIIKYELPLIRYGIYEDAVGNKVARIYMVQRKKIYEPSIYIDQINKIFSQINSGIKEQRNVPPSMVIVLSVFIGMLKKEGISDIIVADFITRRYEHFKCIDDDDERNRIQFNATNTFIDLFLRLSQHFKGFNISAFPNDIDSFMHIKIDDELECNSKLLERCYLLGYEFNEYKNKN